jgi:hypothetical protein
MDNLFGCLLSVINFVFKFIVQFVGALILLYIIIFLANLFGGH